MRHPKLLLLLITILFAKQAGLAWKGVELFNKQQLLRVPNPEGEGLDLGIWGLKMGPKLFNKQQLLRVPNPGG